MQSVMNLKIKFRECSGPFAPCVLVEDGRILRSEPGQESPYMLIVAPVRPDKRLDGDGTRATGLDRLRDKRSVIPAVTHVDYSARVQTVDRERHGPLYELMSRFKARTGCPVIINTSFNIRGEPIVCTPEHAYRCFMATDMDVLVLGRHLLYKHEQPQVPPHDVERYKSQFKLD